MNDFPLHATFKFYIANMFSRIPFTFYLRNWIIKEIECCMQRQEYRFEVLNSLYVLKLSTSREKFCFYLSPTIEILLTRDHT